MVASIKSCYSSSLGIPLFNDSPLKGDDYDKFLKNSEDFLTLHTCVTNAANSDLLQEYSEFAREMRDNKRAENNQKVSANKNLGAGSYPPDMMLTILILKEYRNVDFDEIAMSCYLRLPLGNSIIGEVCEWLKQQVSKTCKPQGFEGSNPSLSEKFAPV